MQQCYANEPFSACMQEIAYYAYYNLCNSNKKPICRVSVKMLREIGRWLEFVTKSKTVILLRVEIS